MTQLDKATMGPIVSLRYTTQKGFVLHWNTKGMLAANKNMTIKHIMILTENSLPQTITFLNAYYSKMRLGDLLGIVYPSKNDKIGYDILWIQKSNTGTNINQFFKQKHFIRTNVIQVIGKVTEIFQKNKELILVTIYPTNQKKEICQLVKGLRYEKIDNIIFFLCEKEKEFYSNANVIDGIMCWDFSEKEEMERSCNEMKIYTNLIALSRLTIRIESLNGTLASQDNCNWHNIDFSTIEKVYYGLFSTEATEYIFFVTNQSLKKFTLELKVFLNYRLVNGKEITCTKKITLQNNNTRIYQRTFAMEEQVPKEFHLHKELSIRSNFAKKQTTIWVSEIIESSSQ